MIVERRHGLPKHSISEHPSDVKALTGRTERRTRLGGYFCTTESVQVEGVSARPGARCGGWGPAKQPTPAAAPCGTQPLPEPIAKKPAIYLYKLTDTLHASTTISAIGER